MNRMDEWMLISVRLLVANEISERDVPRAGAPILRSSLIVVTIRDWSYLKLGPLDLRLVEIDWGRPRPSALMGTNFVLYYHSVRVTNLDLTLVHDLARVDL